MSEHLPNPEQPRLTDDDHIREAIKQAHERFGETHVISDAAARMIASQLHGGQGSALYAFVSTGAFSVEAVEEADREFRNESHSDEVREWADELQQYLIRRDMDGRLDPVENWHKLWLGELPATVIDRAQKLYDEESGYQAFINAFTKDELIELWEKARDGMTYSFDDEVYDALHVGYNYWAKDGES